MKLEMAQLFKIKKIKKLYLIYQKNYKIFKEFVTILGTFKTQILIYFKLNFLSLKIYFVNSCNYF